ncbi:hypothetical protein [Moraxella nonliquefaciens]
MALNRLPVTLTFQIKPPTISGRGFDLTWSVSDWSFGLLLG